MRKPTRRQHRYAEAALARACAAVEAAPTGLRNASLNMECYGLAQLAAGGVLDPDAAAAALAAAAVRAGLDRHEVQQTLRSGFAAGLRQPRAPQPGRRPSRAWRDWQAPIRTTVPPPPVEPAPDPAKLERVREIAASSTPIGGTLAERYLLVDRGIVREAWPDDLRFADLVHPYHRAAGAWPCMVALIRDRRGALTGVQSTWLARSGAGKADLDPPRLSFGSLRGGAVRLAPAADTVALVEGTEKALALGEMIAAPVWALCGTAQFSNFDPPAGLRRVILSPDSDAAGDAALEKAAPRLADMGIDVTVLRPPRGLDWDDVVADWHERAAIMEYDGGMDRSEAERRACAEIVGGGDGR